MRFSTTALAFLTLVVPTSAAAEPPKTNEAAAMMRSFGSGGSTGKALEQAIAKAAAHPLGSKDNPVRADMPDGERAYLARLRCPDGRAPAYERSGSTGVGPYGYILDVYAVTCAGKAPQSIFLDMYHRHVEAAPVPGFTFKTGLAAPVHKTLTFGRGRARHLDSGVSRS